jgi:hypothetical protein
MTYIKVKDKNHLERDKFSNAIVNTDVENYEKYLETYRQKYSEKQKITNLENEMNVIKNDLSEIKNLLVSLIKNESY